MQQPKRNFIEICRRYCQYFREETKENEACEGLKKVAKLFENHELTPIFTENISSILRKNDAILHNLVCADCNWRIHDCDYRSPCPPLGAMPCGGLIYLALLLEEGLIDETKLAGFVK